MQRLLLVIVLTAGSAAGQPLEYGARIAALGGAGSALKDLSSLRLNPGSLATSTSPSIMMGFSRAFGVPELDHIYLEAAVRVGQGALGLAVETFGFQEFRYQALEAALAKKFETSNIAVGVLGSARHTSIAKSDAPMTFSAGAGLIAAVGAGFNVAATVLNAVQSNDLFAGRALVVGASFHPAPELTVVTDLYREVAFPISLRTGIEVRPVRAFSLRGGMSTAPQTLSVGIGIAAGIVRSDVAAQRHAVLGWSRAMGIRLGR